MAAPSHDRTWRPDQAELPYAHFHGARVTVHNVRNCQYFEEGAYVVAFEDRTYDLNRLKAVDFFVVPFPDMPQLAHTMLSFEFAEPHQPPEHLAVSVEIRKEADEAYDPLKGTARQYEIMYVVADERDAVQQRTNYTDQEVYLYRSTATPEQARRMFVDVLGRINGIYAKPEFYHTLTNNCTTNIVRHINRIQPGRVVYDYRVLLPGLSDQLAYKEGLIERHGTFEQTKERAFINPKAWLADGREDFSIAIRR